MTAAQLLFNKQKNRQLLALALPMILSNITIPLLGLVDTAVVGHLSDAYYLGGVAVGSMIITLILWLCGFLRMATTGLVAQAYGAQDHDQQYKLLVQSCSLALLLGSAVILLQWPILQLALSFSDASAAVQLYCQQYFSIRIWSSPLALMNLALLGWLLGRQQPKAAMWQLIFANLTNVVLDILFVLVFDWGVKGAAWASVFADLVGFIVAATMVARQLNKAPNFHIDLLRKHLNFSGYGQLLRLNRDIFVRSLCLQVTFAFMTLHGASLGDATVAANAVLLNLMLLISYALDGIAYYAEAEVGRSYGQKNHQQMRDAVTLAWLWSAIIAICFSLLFWLFGSPFIDLMTDIDAVKQTALTYLPWVIALPILSFCSYLFDGVYIGAAQGRVMRNSMIIASLGVFFPVWWLFQAQGNHALWLAMSSFMLARSLTLLLHYKFSQTFKA